MPRSDDPSTAILIITFKSPEKDEKTRLEIPLLPQTSNLEIVDVNLHGSSTKAYNMGEPYNSWFSSCFGWEVMLVYLGPSLRPILGNLSPNAVDKSFAPNKSWLSSITDQIPSLTKAKSEDKEGITFADVAPYLIVTEESLHDVSSRLSEGKEMDITKFRPNIVLSGSPTAYDEDYWGGIVITANTKFEQRGRLNIEMVLTQNCARCKSLNVDYSTGKPGIDETGTILKTLMKDRRVDKGTKYSPIFGRYGFLKSMVQPTKEITVGDEVIVSKRNQERTKFGGYLYQ